MVIKILSGKADTGKKLKRTAFVIKKVNMQTKKGAPNHSVTGNSSPVFDSTMQSLTAKEKRLPA